MNGIDMIDKVIRQIRDKTDQIGRIETIDKIHNMGQDTMRWAAMGYCRIKQERQVKIG